MRSRYSAYAAGEFDHVFRTWHPRTRAADVSADAALVWDRLEVIETVDCGREDPDGVVEFRAHYRVGGTRGVMHERSSFARRAGRWVYVDADEITD